jgi:hypothetical protein
LYSSIGCLHCAGPQQPIDLSVCPSDAFESGDFATRAEAYSTGYYFYDIATVGTEIMRSEWSNPLNTWNHDDGTFDVILPFDLMWYMQHEPVLSIGTNGLITFGTAHLRSGITERLPCLSQGLCDGTNYEGHDTHADWGIDGVIAPFWADINPEAGGSVFYKVFDDESKSIVVQWDEVPYWTQSGAMNHIKQTFQAIMWSDGAVVFSYKTMSPNHISWTHESIGYEDSTGRLGDQISYLEIPESQTSYFIPAVCSNSTCESSVCGLTNLNQLPGVAVILGHHVDTSTNEPVTADCSSRGCGFAGGSNQYGLIDMYNSADLWRSSPYGFSDTCSTRLFLTIDLGDAYPVSSLALWHNHDADVRRYCGLKVALSSTCEFLGEEVVLMDTGAGYGPSESAHGIWPEFNQTTVNTRCVRHWAGRNNANEGIHFLEVDVYGTPEPVLPRDCSNQTVSANVSFINPAGGLDGESFTSGANGGLVFGYGSSFDFLGSDLCLPCGCADDTAPLSVFLQLRTWTEEISWNFDGQQATSYSSSDTHATDAAVVQLSHTENHTFYFVDSWGDGWHGGYWELINHCGVTIGGGYPPGLEDTAGQHEIEVHGAAVPTACGLNLHSNSDSSAQMEHFDYSSDGTFAVAWWQQKTQCSGGPWEYVYSHGSRTSASGIFNPDNQHIDFYVKCQSNVLGGFLREVIIADDGKLIASDFPLRSAGEFDEVTARWVHLAYIFSNTGQQMIVDGRVVNDGEYIFSGSVSSGFLRHDTVGTCIFCGNPTMRATVAGGNGNIVITRGDGVTQNRHSYRQFGQPYVGSTLSGPIWIGGRFDGNGQLYFHGNIAGVTISTESVCPQTVQMWFSEFQTQLLQCALLSEEAETGVAIGASDYSWVNITATGAQIASSEFIHTLNAWALDDGYFEWALPFAFEFYGHEETVAHICTNGYITFGDGVYSYGHSLPMPTPGWSEEGVDFAINSMIAIFWSDLDPTADGAGIYFHGSASQAVVSYVEVPLYGAPHMRSSFQLVLYPDGDLKMQYKAIPRGESHPQPSVGFQTGDGSLGEQIAFGWGAAPQAETAVYVHYQEHAAALFVEGGDTCRDCPTGSTSSPGATDSAWCNIAGCIDGTYSLQARLDPERYVVSWMQEDPPSELCAATHRVDGAWVALAPSPILVVTDGDTISKFGCAPCLPFTLCASMLWTVMSRLPY